MSQGFYESVILRNYSKKHLLNTLDIEEVDTAHYGYFLQPVLALGPVGI